MKLFHGWGIWILILSTRATTGYFHQMSRQNITYPNLEVDSYFGYSIAYQSSTKRLIIGAPKTNVIGQVFTVDIDGSDVKPAETPEILNKNVKIIEAENNSHKKFLYGAMVKASDNFFVTCAPKNAIHLKLKSTKTTIVGLCFKKPTNGTLRVTDDDKLFYRNWIKPYGWGLDITKTDALLVGAPGASYGRAKVVKNNDFTELKGGNYEVNFSFGYSVASGNYFDDKSITSLYYAVSTPYGKNGTGMVLFFDSENLKHLYTIYDYNLGSLFGAALCTVNLNDRRDHILVGAPTYSKGDNIDRGAVHLYIFKDNIFTLHKTIESSSDTVYFGYSLANLGDMDGDKKDEVAIGAPYEDDGRGAVYIYSGKNLLDLNINGDQMLVQRIQPEATDGILSFGLSLTSIHDYDENGCNELAVGAPESNFVVVYKCFGYITIKVYTKFISNTIQIQANETWDKFIFQSCFDVEYPKKPVNIDEKIHVQVKITHQDVSFRTESSNNEDAKTNVMTYDVRITRDMYTYCNDIELAIRKNRILDDNRMMADPMVYTITASLIDEPRTSKHFDSHRVLLSKQSKTVFIDEASLSDCTGEICKPNLHMEFRPNMTNPYIVGSTSNGSFSFMITNKGATVYTPCLLVKVKGAPLLHLPKGCTTTNGEDLVCKPTALLKNDSVWETGNISFDTRTLTSKNEEITVLYILYDYCNNQAEKVESYKQKYILLSDVRGIEIEKKLEPGDNVDIFSEESRVRHIYTITNSGPTTWEGVNIDIVLTKKQNVVTYYRIIVESEDERRYVMMSEDEIEGEFHVNCNNINLPKDKNVKVIIPFVVVPLKSDSAVVKHNITTTVYLHLKNDTKESSAVTHLIFKKSTVPLWIILMASLIGLFLVIVLAYALFSLGCLKRKKKGELRKLKRSVYRQSIQRMSMRQGKRDGEELEEPLVDKPTDTTEEGLNNN